MNNKNVIVLNGDIKLFLFGDTTDIRFTEIGIESDNTLDTAVLISLYTNKNWWGANYLDGINDFGSNIDTVKNISPSNLPIVQKYAEEALQWLLDDNYVSTLDVTVRINDERQFVIDVSLDASINNSSLLIDNLFAQGSSFNVT